MQGGKHSAAAYTELEKWAYGSCVASLTSFVVSAGTGMNVNISTGAGLISDTIARRIGTDATETATVPTASASFNRLDSVVAYIDTSVTPSTGVTDNTNNILKFVVVAGTAASTPVAPTGAAIISAIGAGKPYMVLYDVLVPQNATNTSGMTFTDRRVVMSTPSIPDGIVTTAKVANLAVTKAKVAAASIDRTKIDFTTGGGVWWEELGRVSLSSPATSLSLTGLATKKYLKVRLQGNASGGTLSLGLQFNNDTANNYNYTVLYNSGGTPVFTASGSQSKMQISTTFISGASFGFEIDITNPTTFNKFINLLSVGDITNVATGYAPSLEFYTGKWVNASQITRIDLIRNAGTGNFGAGSDLIVLGHD